MHFPNELYRGNGFYVPQVESMDIDTLTPGKNAAFEVCDGRYWMAFDDAGKVVGRVAAIINGRYNAKVGQKICRFGWVDFIESQDVVDSLMHRVEEYARDMGMEKVEGPVGFLEFDVSGVLVDGFDRLPTAYGKYNFPYYEAMLLKADRWELSLVGRNLIGTSQYERLRISSAVQSYTLTYLRPRKVMVKFCLDF